MKLREVSKAMKAFSILLACAVIVGLVGGTPQPVNADTQAVKQQIQAEYMKADAATRTKDINALMSHYTSDFKLKTASGKILGLDKIKDNLIWQFVATKQVKEISFRIQSITVSGNTAVLLVKQSETLVVMMEGVQHTLESTQISSDTWLKTPSGWKLKAQTVKLSNTLEDGKVKSTASIVLPTRELRASHVA